jgi:hypothetical protein
MNNKIIRAIICLQLIAVSISAIDGSEANPASSFDLPAVVTGATHRDVTNITATKEIVPNATGVKNSPDIKLTLAMPGTPAKLDIVLAMDTSGSMNQHYMDDDSGRTHINWSADAIGPIIDHYPEARVSIVSWDDEDERNDTMTNFFDLSTPGNRSIVEEILRGLHSECKETDHTVYSIGVKRAVEAMDRHPPSDPVNTARIIIFVTGLSEFMAEPKNASRELTLRYQLENARQNRTYNRTSFYGYQIPPVQIGMDPNRFPWELDNVTMIMNETRIRNGPLRAGPYSKDDIEELDGTINEILGDLKKKSLAQDIVVVDTLYPYLDYRGSVNSRNLVPIKNLSDGLTTLTWNVGEMKSDEIWWALIHTRLNISLPIEVSDKMTPVVYEVANTTPVSEVRYRYLTGFNGTLPFPEGEIKF